MSVLGPKQTFVGVIAMSANRDRAKFSFAKRPEFYRLAASLEAYSGNFGSGALMDPNTLGVLTALSIVAISVAIAWLLFALIRR
jgi:hypothetical protein